jgi:hypothetical protein
VLCLVFPALGQEPRSRAPDAGRTVSLGNLSPTPEMWFYEQARRQYEDPRTMVRQKAEFKAVHREWRIAARKWFGFSNSRPRVSAEPFYGSRTPHWASNSYDPFAWRGIGGVTVIREAAATTTQTR